MRYASWGVIVDDIVFPDGRTAIGVLGGGGMYAAVGMAIWTNDVGVVGNVGADFDLMRLRAIGLRYEGIHVTPRPTPRAWQLFEVDGTRTQIPRIPNDDWQAQLAPTLSDLDGLHDLRAVHVLSRGQPNDPQLVAQIAARGIRISLEPIIEDGLSDADCERILACLPHVELFSPGIAETRRLVGDLEPAAALREFTRYGAAIAAQRRGATGSLVYHQQSQRLLQVPAAPANVVDVTGAGNAYCGGFFVNWVEHGNLERAAAAAAVSAALTIEQVGPPRITPTRREDAKRRLDETLASIESL